MIAGREQKAVSSQKVRKQQAEDRERKVKNRKQLIRIREQIANCWYSLNDYKNVG